MRCEMSFKADQKIGAYTLLRPLGSGGMGEVWLAERANSDFQQQVAVKLMQTFQRSAEGMRRFARERQILAGLNHPGIARLLDGGVSEDGQPYYVMEYVDGISLVDYCRKNNLSISDKLRLFCEACSAVMYAHRKLIIHSDLKPEHILVDTEGQIKLLDFGLARLEGQQSAATVHSAQLTPAYASPEQIAGEVLTTSTDVYSLGVILYELLSSKHPFDLNGKSAIEALKIVSETQPVRPSLQRGGKGAEQLSEELDLICLKALEKLSEERYESVEALAEDLQRYLDGLPIEAKAKSRTYRLRKFASRNLIAVGLSTLAFIAVLATVGFYTLQLQEERATAFQELQKAESLNRFFQQLFKVDNRRGNYPVEITARELVDAGARRIEGELKNQPKERVELIRTISVVYKRLGMLHPAKELQKRGVELALQLYPENSVEVAVNRNALADALYYTGKYAEAESLMTLVLQVAGDKSNPEYDPKAYCNVLGRAGKIKRRLRKHDEALTLYEEAFELAKVVDDTATTLGTMNNLSTSYRSAGRIEEAEKMYLQLIPMAKEFYRDQHPFIPIALNNLAALYRRSGRREKARQLYEESLARREKNYGLNHPGLSLALSNLAGFYREEGEDEKTIELFRRAIKISKEFHGINHPYVLDNLGRLTKHFSNLGRFGEGEETLAELEEITRKSFEHYHLRTARLERTIAHFYRNKKVLDKAERHYRLALKIINRIMKKDDPGRYIYIYSMGRFLQDRNREEEAERYLLECLALIHRKPQRLKSRRVPLYKKSILLYEALNLPEEVQKFKSMLAEITEE